MSSILFEILLLRYIVDRYNDNFNLNHFTVIMFCLLIFQITVWLIESYYVQYFNEDSNNKVNQYFYSKLFKKIEMTPLCNFEDPKFYDEHYFIVNDVNNRINEFTSLLETFVSSLLMIITLSSLIVITAILSGVQIYLSFNLPLKGNLQNIMFSLWIIFLIL